MRNYDTDISSLSTLEAMFQLENEKNKCPYRMETDSACDDWIAILVAIFSGPQIHHRFNIAHALLDKSYRNDVTGRLLWIFRVPAIDGAVPPFIDNPCRNFIIELNFRDGETHAAQTEKLIRRKVGDTFVPKRLMKKEAMVQQGYLGDRKHKVFITVYESVEGVKNLSEHWKKNINGPEVRSIIQDLVEMKRTMSFITPPESDFMVLEDPQSSLCHKADVEALHLSFDMSRWDIVCDKEHRLSDPAVLLDAKPILALLNRHIPEHKRAEAVVSPDGKSITLQIPGDERRIPFTADEMNFLREKMFLNHNLVDPADVFIQGSGKDCKVVAVLGWETAEYCPSGYSMGERDAMLGRDIKDTAWYLLLRREGRKRRHVKGAWSHPAQIKLADTMHIMDSFRDLSLETRGDYAAKSAREVWMQKRKNEWKGGRIGWHSTWMAEFKNVFRDRVDYLFED